MSKDLSHVGMFNCFYCGRPAGVLLDRSLRKTLPRNVGVLDRQPCSECKEFMEQGVICISVDASRTTDAKNPYRSGGWCVVKERGIQQMPFDDAIKESVLEQRVLFLEDMVWFSLGLPGLTAFRDRTCTAHLGRKGPVSINTMKKNKKELFSLGDHLVITAAALKKFPQSFIDDCIRRHHSGDWGSCSENDKKQNDAYVRTGGRLMSTYADPADLTLWVITEDDRSVTTALLPSDY